MTLTAAQKGAALMVAGVFCMASMDVMAKTLGHSIPVAQIVWLRFVSQALVVGAGLLIARRALFTSAHTKLHMLRGLATTFSSYMFFLGIIYLPLADATALIQLGPVMVTLGAVLVLGETIGRRRILGIAAAFLGAMMIIRPGSSVMSPASIFPILGAIGFTVYALATRFVRSDGPWTALFLQGVFGTIFSSMLVPFFWQRIPIAEVPIVAALIGFGILGHLLMIRAFAAAPAGDIAPYGYAGLLFAVIFGLVLFGETPDGFTLLGAVVIVTAGIYVWYRERLIQAQDDNG
ncbi:Pseudopaline exporter CntI [Rhodobacteraceae bacterium IMCC1933]|nr:Pseudopaline exporter CntI [Rhodobacteraceae bacterium IMCC1923]MDP4067684.1 Pseudopaline exporter CntI [Rhodobacteraceae bacterium IMCC1933]MDP4070884.1 Pseudopaline exporter CntI [Rhodobacteraceae bacterium IMCC1909]